MKVLLIAFVLTMSGCALTPSQKTVLGWSAAIVVTGFVAAHSDDKGQAQPGPIGPGAACHPQPDGTCR